MRRARLVIFSAVTTLALSLSVATTHTATSGVATTPNLALVSQNGAQEAIERAEKADDSVVRHLARQEAQRQHAEAEVRRVEAAARHAEEHRLAAERRRALEDRKAAVRAERASRAAVPEAPPQTQGDIHDALAMCESGMDQNRHSTGKVIYHSYFQWLISTWNNVSGLPGDPHDYDYATQKKAVQKIPLTAWETQFPGCRLKLQAAGWAIP